MSQNIVIIAERDGEQIKSTTWELFEFARKIAEKVNCGILFCVIEGPAGKVSEKIGALTGCRTISIETDNADHYDGEFYRAALPRVLAKHNAAYILAPHSTSGMDYAPALSILLNGRCITAVEDVDTETESLFFVRALYNGKVQARLESPEPSVSSPLILTIQSGSAKTEQPDGASSPQVIREAVNSSETRMRYKGRHPSPSSGSNLAKAEVIISGGRGIEEEENYSYIEMLANIFPRAATGASRPICDYGWAEYSKQVGATGTIVAPKLYIACGISGSTQHLEGIRDSRCIVVINKDPDAPIFQVADICIVEDLCEFIPLLVETFNSKAPGS